MCTAGYLNKMTNVSAKITIKGLTNDGKKFRPSDWAERLTASVATFGRGRRMIFHPSVHMVTIDGISCVVVDSELEQHDPMLFGFLMDFGKSNNLQILNDDNTPPQHERALQPELR
jgi:hypothetical protein